MKKKLILHLDRGRIIVIKNLDELWIQPLLMTYGWHLCYSDDKYKRNIIYFSYNRSELEKVSEKIAESYEKGEKSIRI